MAAEATLPPGPVGHTRARQIKEDLALCLRYSTQDGVAAIPIVTMALPASMALTALVTKTFPLSETAIGVLASLPFVGNFLQIFFSPALMRWRPPKTITVAAAALNLLTWLALGIALPWTPRPAAAWILGWFLVSSFTYAIASVTWSTWVEEWVPARVRGKYFGRRNQIIQFSAVVFLVISGWILSQWDYSVGAFQAVILGSCVLRIFSIRMQGISPTRPRTLADPAGVPFRVQAAVVRGARSFLVFVAFGAVWSFATNCFGPFYTVFMFQRVGFSAWDVGVVTAISQVGGACSLPVWGRLLDRHGNKPVMVVSLVLWQLSMFVWCLATPGNRIILYFLWAWIGATSAGFVLGQFTIGLRLIPAGAKRLAIGFNLAVSSFIAAIAPVLGGWTIAHAPAGWGSTLEVYHICFLLQPIVALAGALLLLRVHEPDVSPLAEVVGSMRNVRTMAGVLGLSFLVNQVFVGKPTRRK